MPADATNIFNCREGDGVAARGAERDGQMGRCTDRRGHTHTHRHMQPGTDEHADTHGHTRRQNQEAG